MFNSKILHYAKEANIIKVFKVIYLYWIMLNIKERKKKNLDIREYEIKERKHPQIMLILKERTIRKYWYYKNLQWNRKK